MRPRSSSIAEPDERVTIASTPPLGEAAVALKVRQACSSTRRRAETSSSARKPSSNDRSHSPGRSPSSVPRTSGTEQLVLATLQAIQGFRGEVECPPDPVVAGVAEGVGRQVEPEGLPGPDQFPLIAPGHGQGLELGPSLDRLQGRGPDRGETLERFEAERAEARQGEGPTTGRVGQQPEEHRRDDRGGEPGRIGQQHHRRGGREDQARQEQSQE